MTPSEKLEKLIETLKGEWPDIELESMIEKIEKAYALGKQDAVQKLDACGYFHG